VTCRVPYLGGRTLAQARVRLPAAHCAIGRVTIRWAGRQNAHRIVGQAVHGGTLLSAGTKVALVQGTKKRPPRRHRPSARGHAKKRAASGRGHAKKRAASARGHAKKRAASRTGRSR
jgi:hypothetical protein